MVNKLTVKIAVLFWVWVFRLSSSPCLLHEQSTSDPYEKLSESYIFITKSDSHLFLHYNNFSIILVRYTKRVKQYHLCSLILNHPRRLICHWDRNKNKPLSVTQILTEGHIFLVSSQTSRSWIRNSAKRIFLLKLWRGEWCHRWRNTLY